MKNKEYENQLNVLDKNGTICIEWDVNKRSNPDDEWFDDKDIMNMIRYSFGEFDDE